MEVGDEEKSEEMNEKIYPNAGRLEKMEFPRFSFFATWRWEMSRKVKKWKKSYPSAGRLGKMGFPTFFPSMHGGGISGEK